METKNNQKTRGLARFTRNRTGATMRVPSEIEMAEWVVNGEGDAVDGCWVKSGEICSHGKKLWPLELGWSWDG